MLNDPFQFHCKSIFILVPYSKQAKGGDLPEISRTEKTHTQFPFGEVVIRIGLFYTNLYFGKMSGQVLREKFVLINLRRCRKKINKGPALRCDLHTWDGIFFII